MDRDSRNDQSAAMIVPQPPVSNAPGGPVLVSVCVTCKPADGGAIAGPDLLAALQAALADTDREVVVRPVQCLGVCKRPATAAVTSGDGYTFLFGDLDVASGAPALVSFVQSYQRSDYGLVPWRERAQVLRRGMVARVPPARWSPDDGRPPT